MEKLNPPVVSIPIDDLDERASSKAYSDEERNLRCQLAAAYRLVDLYGWSEGIFNHITVRLPCADDRFLMNPFGLFFHEITASSLITVDPDGRVLDAGSTNFGPNPRGFTLHSALHEARRDAHCVLHLHTPQVIAMSSAPVGFVPICQEGMAIGPVSVLDFAGILTDLNERQAIVEGLGKNNVMLLRNHGFVTCGVSIADAFLKAYFFIYNMRAQVHLTSLQKPILPSPEAIERTYDGLKRGEITEREKSSLTNGHPSENDTIEWGPGGMEWEANMRLLDDLGLRSGHRYRLKTWRD